MSRRSPSAASRRRPASRSSTSRKGERRGRNTARGGVLWEDTTYSDRRVLMSIPRGFDLRKPSLIVVFFHGNGATLTRDVRNRQQVPRQIVESGLNAVLVAPQFAVDAANSSAGRFWEPGVFAQFMSEAADQLARLHGDARARAVFERAPVVIAAYSGGYHPLAFVLVGRRRHRARARRAAARRALRRPRQVSRLARQQAGGVLRQHLRAAGEAAERGVPASSSPTAASASPPASRRTWCRGSMPSSTVGDEVKHNDFVDPGLVGRPAQGDAVARAGLCAALSARPIAPPIHCDPLRPGASSLSEPDPSGGDCLALDERERNQHPL